MATLTITEAEYTEGHAMKRISGKHTQETAIEKISELAVDERSDPDALPEGSQYPTGMKFWLLMLNLAAVIILGAIDMSIVATAVPTITDHFHTVADIGWYSIAFRLCQCSFQFLYAKTKGRSHPTFLKHLLTFHSSA